MQGSPEARMSHFDQNGDDPQSGLSDKSSGQPLRSIQAFAEVGVIIIILLLYIIIIVVFSIVINQHTSLD